MTTIVNTPSELLDLAGADLGTTEWVEIDQERINLFADATGDHQWIHVDVERATAESPVRRADRPRLPHAVAGQPVPPQLLTVERRLDGRQRRARQGAVPGAGPRRQPDPRSTARSSASTRWRAACRWWSG